MGRDSANSLNSGSSIWCISGQTPLEKISGESGTQDHCDTILQVCVMHSIISQNYVREAFDSLPTPGPILAISSVVIKTTWMFIITMQDL